MFHIFLLSLSFAWDYSKHGSDWTGLCSTGQSQSPINIQQGSTSRLGSAYSMEVYYYGQTISRTVVNNGKYIYIEGDFGYITIEDLDSNQRQFLTTRIEFHIPSEHYIEGFPTHMEMQIFHTISDSDYTFDFPSSAVVSIMLRPGDDSYFFDSINVTNLPYAGGTTVLPSNANVNLLSIITYGDNYFFYNGSLNEPDCEEDYLWYVFQTEQWISFSQISYFQRLFTGGADPFAGGGDSRAIQPLHSRTVYYSGGLTAFIFGLTIILLMF